MDNYQCNSNLLKIEDDSITMQELSSSIEEIINTQDIYLIFKPPAIHDLFNKANVEYAATNHDIFNEIANNKIEFMSTRNSFEKSPVNFDIDDDLCMKQEFSGINKHQVIKKALTDTMLKKNKYTNALTSSKNRTKEEIPSEIPIKSIFKIVKRCNKNYSNLIQMYCSKCNKVSINIDTKCEDCQTLLLFQCNTCDCLFKRLISIQNHIKYECFKGSVFYCNECNFESVYKFHLIKHIKNEHSDLVSSKKIFVCSICQKKFKNQPSMLSHERVCSNEIILKCKYCAFKTKLSWVLTKHVELKHQRFHKKNYQCPDCGKKYECFKNLNRHIKKLCGQKLKCDHCNYTINRKYSLAKHIQQNHFEIFLKNKFLRSL